MAVRHSAMLCEERVNTVFNLLSSVTHPQWRPRGAARNILIFRGGRGGLKWTVFIRVRNAVHRVKNASVSDNNVITPCYDRRITDTVHGGLRSAINRRLKRRCVNLFPPCSYASLSYVSLPISSDVCILFWFLSWGHYPLQATAFDGCLLHFFWTLWVNLQFAIMILF